MQTVECIDLDGNMRKIAKDDLILRPAAYAVVVHDGKVLLLRMRHTGKYHLPGGGTKVGEKMEDTLKRELLEETGIEADVGRLAHFQESFFYYDPSGKAYHGLHFYFICRPRTFTLLPDEQVNDDAAEMPRWMAIRELQASEFQIYGEMKLRLCKEAATSAKTK